MSVTGLRIVHIRVASSVTLDVGVCTNWRLLGKINMMEISSPKQNFETASRFLSIIRETVRLFIEITEQIAGVKPEVLGGIIGGSLGVVGGVVGALVISTYTAVSVVVCVPFISIAGIGIGIFAVRASTTSSDPPGAEMSNLVGRNEPQHNILEEH